LDRFGAVAAVADYRPEHRASVKQKKHGGEITLKLVPTVDILKTLAHTKRPGQIVVGFAAETNRVEEYAQRKLVEKRLDWIVANDMGQPGIGMDADANAVILLGRSGERRTFGPAPKGAVAEFILDNVAGA